MAYDKNIMTIKEIIDAAFGEPDVNIVNHKLIQTVLYLLARQLRILERRVKIEIVQDMELESSTSISVSEVKIHAAVPRKKRRLVKAISGGPKGGVERGSANTSGAGGSGTGTGGTRTAGTVGKPGIVGKTATGIKDPGDRESMDRSITEKSTSDRTTTETSSTMRSSTDKYYTQKTSSDKSSSDKTTATLTSSDKTSTEKTTSDKTSTDKTSTDKTSTDKTSTDKTSTDKTSTDKTSTDKTSTDKTSTDKTSTDKTSSARTSSDKTSTEKSTTLDKTSTEKSSSDKTTTDISSSDKTTTQMGSSRKTTTTPDKFGFDKTSQDTSTAKSKTKSKTTSSLGKRADSREERDKTPTPMTSMDSMEVQYEKLLVVERIPSKEAKALASRLQGETRGRTPQLSIVTQEEFSKLASTVRALEETFGPISGSGFPENIQLMQELRKGASLTDAMAALQLSARLEASEKALERMMSLLTELASKTPGFDLTGEKETKTEVLFGASDAQKSRKSIVFKKGNDGKASDAPQEAPSDETLALPPLESEPPLELPPEPEAEPEDVNEPQNLIIVRDLDNAIQEIYDEFVKTVTGITNRSKANADTALKIANKLEGKLDDALNLGTRMSDLETLVAEYAEQINILDTSLTSQMTNYQEELTQMQHDLEIGLEAMAEALASAGGDTTAVAELNTHFNNLQIDFETTNIRQKELQDIQTALSIDLQDLWKQIEILRESKSDREEVADALRDKAGLGALNGLVSLQQFDAIRGDFEKKIGAAYEKFNNQEIVWQKAIDDLLRELSEKADWLQVIALRDDINNNLRKLNSRIQAMLEIVGEPQAAAVSRILHRDAACLSCSTPAHMALEEPGTIPALPAFPTSRPPAVGAEAPKEDGDHGVCYPGLPIPHPRDPRSHVCNRYCGGSHTRIPNTKSRTPVGMIVNPALRRVTTEVGTNGKLYMTDETYEKNKPCLPCNKPVNTAKASISEQVLSEKPASSNMTPSDFNQDFHQFSMNMPQLEESASVTPPMIMDD